MKWYTCRNWRRAVLKSGLRSCSGISSIQGLLGTFVANDKGTFIRKADLSNWVGLMTILGVSATVSGAGAGMGLPITVVAVFTAIAASLGLFIVFIVRSPD